MTLLLTVLASVWVDALLGTVTSSVADFLTVHALGLGLCGLALSLLLLAMLHKT